MAEQHTPRSLIVSLYGAYGRAPDESPVPVAALIRLLGALGVDAPSVRSSVSRLKRRGLLLPRRFSRDTEERTEGASTPSPPRSRISAATGMGDSSGPRPYAP